MYIVIHQQFMRFQYKLCVHIALLRSVQMSHYIWYLLHKISKIKMTIPKRKQIYSDCMSIFQYVILSGQLFNCLHVLPYRPWSTWVSHWLKTQNLKQNGIPSVQQSCYKCCPVQGAVKLIENKIDFVFYIYHCLAEAKLSIRHRSVNSTSKIHFDNI